MKFFVFIMQDSAIRKIVNLGQIFHSTGKKAAQFVALKNVQLQLSCFKQSDITTKLMQSVISFCA
jgi:hypothetical protein